MKIIKRHATLSTNQDIKEYVLESDISEPICLYADSQLQGKGQRGNTWVSEPNKNLTCSFYFNDIDIHVDKQFDLSIYVALTILRTLDDLGLNNCQIKWPNDILTGEGKKLSGILIENTLSGAIMKSAIIGIGINVGQTDFPGLPNATSILLEKGKKISVERVLNTLISNMRHLDKQLRLQVDIDEYYKNMYRFNEKSTFRDLNGNIFHGLIQGVTRNGYLKVYHQEDQRINEYDIKEIEFMDQA